MTDDATPDLFADMTRAPSRAPRHETPPELRIARSLCRQIKRTPVQTEKRRLAHELCGTLIALCRKGRSE